MPDSFPLVTLLDASGPAALSCTALLNYNSPRSPEPPACLRTDSNRPHLSEPPLAPMRVQNTPLHAHLRLIIQGITLSSHYTIYSLHKSPHRHYITMYIKPLTILGRIHQPINTQYGQSGYWEPAVSNTIYTV